MPILPIMEAIEAKDPKTAASLAGEQNPGMLVEAFDYLRIAEDAEPYPAFVREWIAIAHSLDKPFIASWILNGPVADFSYLEAQAEAAAFLTLSARAAKDHLVDLPEEIKIVARGPEAGLTKDQVANYQDAAAQLRELSIP